VVDRDASVPPAAAVLSVASGVGVGECNATGRVDHTVPVSVTQRALSVTQRALRVTPPSELEASPSELLASPSELVPSPSTTAPVVDRDASVPPAAAVLSVASGVGVGDRPLLARRRLPPPPDHRAPAS
jgi:hypothetical protein